jgi:nitroimidazol reductase NimA-like FMN-containing flavoprotein (pyridoxamine 5'-phosphate oxidase superfamily)
VNDPRAGGQAEMTESDQANREIEERTGSEIMDRRECVALLEAMPIGRIVFLDDEGQPLALPVNYRWHDDSVVFRTLEGQKLVAAWHNQRVSFEVDTWDYETRSGESVIVKGKAANVELWADRELLEQIGLDPWSSGPWRTTWIRITPIEVTGRRVGTGLR